MKQQLTRNFLEGSHRFAKTSLGYEASEPPRGVAWITLIRTQPKGTYDDYLAVTNTIFLGRATKEEDGSTTKTKTERGRRRTSGRFFSNLNCMECTVEFVEIL